MGADCYADGFNYMTRVYATSAIPIAIVLVIWCVWGLRRLCTSSGQTERRANIFSQHVYASLLLSYLVFGCLVKNSRPFRSQAFDFEPDPTPHPTLNLQVLPTVVSVQFKSLRCSELEGLGVRYLRADTSIDCDSAEYQTFVGRVAWLLALYLCVPLVYLALLYRVADRLQAPPGADPKERKLEAAKLRLQEESDPELRPLKFLFNGYRPQYWCVSNYSVVTYSLNR